MKMKAYVIFSRNMLTKQKANLLYKCEHKNKTKIF